MSGHEDLIFAGLLFFLAWQALESYRWFELLKRRLP